MGNSAYGAIQNCTKAINLLPLSAHGQKSKSICIQALTVFPESEGAEIQWPVADRQPEYVIMSSLEPFVWYWEK